MSARSLHRKDTEQLDEWCWLVDDVQSNRREYNFPSLWFDMRQNFVVWWSWISLLIFKICLLLSFAPVILQFLGKARHFDGLVKKIFLLLLLCEIDGTRQEVAIVRTFGISLENQFSTSSRSINGMSIDSMEIQEREKTFGMNNMIFQSKQASSSQIESAMGNLIMRRPTRARLPWMRWIWWIMRKSIESNQEEEKFREFSDTYTSRKKSPIALCHRASRWIMKSH